MTAPTRSGGGSPAAPAPRAARAALGLPLSAVFPAFFVVLLLVYWPALEGPWFADDFNNIARNDYVHEFTWENASALLAPAGEPAKLTQNYAPVHLFIHALEWQIFGERFFAYHIVNLALHALASTLLVALLLQSGVPRLGALCGSTIFLVHPANVEAVAWIYQLKTTLALVLVLVALLLRNRAPATALVTFSLALLTKALAAVALPVAILLAWCNTSRISGNGSEHAPAKAWRWLGAWTLAVVALALYGFPAFSETNPIPPLDTDPLVLFRTIVSIAGRYLVMAATGYGVSAFQEVPVARSWLDPWWIGSVVALVLLGARAGRALVRREQEAAYWGWAAASFLPISQLFPFIYPMGDRYLYLMLPGLIGGALLAGRPLVAHRKLALTLLVATAVGLSFFGLRSYQRALLWRRPSLMLEQEAITRFPDGLLANTYKADRAAAIGDADAAVQALRKTLARGDIQFRPLVSEPTWQRLHGDPRISEIIREMARQWVAVSERVENPSQLELRGFAEAYHLLGQPQKAEALLVRALEVGGKRDAAVRAQLDALRETRRDVQVEEETRATDER